jgi:uncharacterized membrane protein
MPPRSLDRLRLILRLVLAAIYIGAGALHLAAADKFLAIMPPVIPFPRAVVLFTGACEVAGAIGLLVPATRRLAGVLLAIYAVCVWPANIYQAFWRVPAPPPARQLVVSRAAHRLSAGAGLVGPVRRRRARLAVRRTPRDPLIAPALAHLRYP